MNAEMEAVAANSPLVVAELERRRRETLASLLRRAAEKLEEPLAFPAEPEGETDGD